MLIEKLRQVRLTHISLTLVGLMWVFPFLHYHHKLPLTSFDQEWWTALLSLLGATLLIGPDYWRQPQFPRIVQLPAAMLVVVMLQWVGGKVAYFDQVMLVMLYMLLAALLMMLGARLRGVLGMPTLARVLAAFLLLGAVSNAIIALLQHYQLRTPLDVVIINKTYAGVFGNLGQSNHFANYISLGLISLGLLFQQGVLRVRYVVPIAALLLFVLMLSGSRSAWLYLLLMNGLSWWYVRFNAARRQLLYFSLLLLAGFGVMHLLLQAMQMYVLHSSVAGVAEGYQPIQRLTTIGTSSNQRLYLWREALVMFRHAPLLGVGFGQFAWHHFQLLPQLQPENIVGAYNNAHNLIFQLAAETGLAGLAALFVPLWIWLKGMRSSQSEPDVSSWWAYAILGVITIHSMLEYPLWYAYFIGVAAFLLGVLDETQYNIRLQTAGRFGVIVLMLLGAFALIQMQSGYRKLERTLAIVPESREDQVAFTKIRAGLLEVMQAPLLSPYAELPLSGQLVVNGEYIREKLAINTRVLHAQPKGSVAYRQAMLLAQADEHEQARVMITRAIWSFPKGFVDARWQLSELAEKDPAHFSALLKFSLEKYQEYQSGVHRK